MYFYPGNEGSIINDYRWIEFMMMWCGFSPEIERDGKYWYDKAKELEMTHYPDDGAIIIIEDHIIVNF